VKKLFVMIAAGVLPLAGCVAQDSTPSADPGAPDPAETVEITIYFTRAERPHPVGREVPRASDLLTAAVELLLRGPTPEERAAGIASFFSSETAGMLSEAVLDENGSAVIDFHDFRTVIPGASSAAGSEALLGELNATVAALGTVDRVEYRIEGSCERFWNFLQRDCAIVRLPP